MHRSLAREKKVSKQVGTSLSNKGKDILKQTKIYGKRKHDAGNNLI